jgi:hypothetical protein
MKKVNQWKTDILYWDKISKDIYLYMFQQGEKALQITQDAHEKITVRAFTLLSIVVPILSVVISYFINHPMMPAPLKAMTAFASVTGFILIWLLAKLVLPRKRMNVGSPPNRLFTAEALIGNIEVFQQLDDDTKFKALMSEELQGIQYRIDYNEAIHKNRVFILKCAYLIILSNITLFLAYTIKTIIASL